jgi:hypothetical protein
MIVRPASLCAVLVVAAVAVGCAATPPTPRPPPVRLDELHAASREARSDELLIAQMEQRGVAFVLSERDLATLREAALGESVLRYLQDRSARDQALAAYIRQGRYPVATYEGATYREQPYLGYYGGLHYYGEPAYYTGSRGVGSDRGRHGGRPGHHRGHR